MYPQWLIIFEPYSTLQVRMHRILIPLLPLSMEPLNLSSFLKVIWETFYGTGSLNSIKLQVEQTIN